MTRLTFSRLRICLAVLCALLLPLCAAFAEPGVRGTLSSNSAGVGEAVEYALIIEGDSAPENPPMPNVDGLEVRGTIQSSQLSIINSNVTRRVTITYTLVPRREGTFTIPPLEVRVGGRVLKTLPATLTVTPGESMKEAGDLAFAKIFFPKQALYVGEVAPMEVRLYLDASATWELRTKPAVSGEGFTAGPLGTPSQGNIQLEGKPYHLVTFATVITPGKAGKIGIGPVATTLVVSKPSRNQPRFDIFGRSLGPAQEMTVTAPEVEMQVKPLPAEGRPKDFSGAIGKFEFAATGTPDHVKIGEPVTVKLTIKGRGNFDRIDQPSLADPNGWTTYSAKQQFEPGDNLGTDGVKTFELPVTPTAKKTAMPVFAFSFFDPDAGKYVTLTSAPAPLKVEGEPAPMSVASSLNENTALKPAQPKEEPKSPAVQDILPNLPELGVVAGGYGLRMSPWVLFSTMFAPLPILLALLAWRSRKMDASAQRISELRREKTILLARVRKSPDRAEALDAATRVLQIDSALEAGQPAAGGELAEVLAARKLDDAAERAVRELFEARNELLYAGGARGGDRLGDTERDRLLETLAAYERSARK